MEEPRLVVCSPTAELECLTTQGTSLLALTMEPSFLAHEAGLHGWVIGCLDPLPPIDFGHWASAVGDGMGDRGSWGIYSDQCHLWLVCDPGPCHNFSLVAPAMSHPLFLLLQSQRCPQMLFYPLWSSTSCYIFTNNRFIKLLQWHNLSVTSVSC